MHTLRSRRTGRARRSRPRTAIVLSGGGSLGAAQVGALRALFDAGVRPDVLVGCSVGALNAGFLAVDPTIERLVELEAIWRRLGKADIFGNGRRLAAGATLLRAVRRDDHLYEPHALQSLVRRWVPVEDLAQTAVPCHVVTTDLLTGAPCWWHQGDPVKVLTASACLPALFPPVRLGDSLHVDGGVTVPVPVERALDLGADQVWVIDVTGGALGRRDERMSALDVLLMSFAISRSHLDRPSSWERPGHEVVRLRMPDLGRIEMRDFSQTERLLQAGYAIARQTLSTLPVPRSG